MLISSDNAAYAEVTAHINALLATLPPSRREELRKLHDATVNSAPGCTLWFSDGKDENGKVVANPTIGYGKFMMQYANGNTREWFRVGISGNKTGISVYILGLNDKLFLANTYAQRIGKAKVTGYCIRFKSLPEINEDVLNEAVSAALALT